MPSVSRAPIPRKIRNLKPKRQLPRNDKANDRDDEWWHNNFEAAQQPSNPQAGAHLRGVAASNESFGTRSRFARPRALDASISKEASENEDENEANRTNNISTPMQMWQNFKSIPTKKKIKRFIAGMVLFTALKSIYFADLDDYQYPQKGVFPNTQPSLSAKKTDNGVSSLRSNVGDVKSLSELLGDDYVGKRGDSYKSSTKTMGGELGQNYGKDKFGSPNDSNGSGLQSSSFNSFGGKSMSDSLGSSGQSNFGSSNNIGSGIQSASFNSFGGKSMSDSLGSSGQSNFGSSNNIGSGIQSASFNSFGGKSMSEDSFGSSQSNFGSSNNIGSGSGMQSASFGSFGGKSMSDGSSGQSNFGSSNNIGSGIQSASFNSFGGKSMSDFGSSGQSNFGSSNNIGSGSGSGMQSASFGSFGGKSMSDSFGSLGQSNFDASNNMGSGSGSGMQSASFGSFEEKVSSPANNNNIQAASFNSYSSDQDGNLQPFHQYSDTQYQAQKSLQQSPNLSVAQDSGQYLQGLRGKSIGTSSGNGSFGSDQFPEVKNAMSNRQSNLIPGNEMRVSLDCAPYGGSSSEEEYSEFVYWRDIASDASFASPYYNPQTHRTKYLTFEMDGSGWNNIRLGFENMMLLAHSMGRTLVMPPKRQIAHGMVSTSQFFLVYY